MVSKADNVSTADIGASHGDGARRRTARGRSRRRALVALQLTGLFALGAAAVDLGPVGAAHQAPTGPAAVVVDDEAAGAEPEQIARVPRPAVVIEQEGAETVAAVLDPLPGASTSVRLVDADRTVVAEAAVTTNGPARFDELEAGEYRLHVYQQVEVEGAEVATSSLLLLASPTFTVPDGGTVEIGLRARS